MELVPALLDLVSPGGEPRPLSRAERLLFAATSFLAALGLGALWGVAAGSHDGHLALDNVGKVPVLLLGSSLVALPVGLLVFRLTSTRGRVSDMLLAHAVGSFAGCLTLALLSPLVALYQFSSSFAGTPVALASGVIGVLVALMVVVRVLRKLSPGVAVRTYGAPLALVAMLQLAALAQLASVTTPVFRDRTPLGKGVDGLVHHRAPRGSSTTTSGEVPADPPAVEAAR